MSRPNRFSSSIFRCRLDQMIDPRHPLTILASRIQWLEIEACQARRLAREAKAIESIQGSDLLRADTAVVGAGTSHAGRPCFPIRLMVSLSYLKHACNEIDEGVSNVWLRRPPSRSSAVWVILSTAFRVTRRCWASFAACWVRKGLKNCSRKPFVWRLFLKPSAHGITNAWWSTLIAQ